MRLLLRLPDLLGFMFVNWNRKLWKRSLERGDDSETVIAPDSPEQEKLISKTGAKISRSVSNIKHASSHYIRKLKMSRLVDRVTLGTIIIFIFIKILQFLKTIGFKAEEKRLA